MIDYKLITILATSLGLGLLVGLQREYSNKSMAGIRTFSLVTLFGSIMGLIAKELQTGWVLGAGIIGMAILFATVNFVRAKEEKPSLGQTTEIALLLMFSLGAYLVIGDLTVGILVGAVTAILLYLKGPLSGFVDRLGDREIRDIMLFVALSLVVLPVLPNEDYGPYQVLNPHDIWLMVVLIVGISLAGYFAYKWLGKNVGTIASGILGGLISSTATTVTFARRTKEVPKAGRLAAFIIATASTVAFVRVMVEVAVVTPENLIAIAPPIMVELLLMLGFCALLFWYTQKEEMKDLPDPENPAQLKSALVFGFLYTLILLAVAATKDFFGEGGLFVVAIISGLTDVDAITLSVSNTLNRGEVDVDIAWRLILLASLSNLVFKSFLALLMGTRQLARYIAIVFSISLVSGLLIIWFWPAAA